MSRGISPKLKSNELLNICDCDCHFFKQIICNENEISNLKAQVFKKEQNKKDYQNLLSIYNKLQEDFAKISEQKRLNEIALSKLVTDERNNSIIKLKKDNEILFNEINKKIDVNQKLYTENNKLFHELENIIGEGNNLHVQIHQQEEKIKLITHDKDEIKNKLNSLNQIRLKQEKDIHDLNIQINKINLHNSNQINILNNKIDKNYDIINNINEEKSRNNNLILELKNKESNLMANQQILNRDNDNIHLIKNDINILENKIKKDNEDISVINSNLIKEKSVISQLSIDNQQLNNCINDRDEKIRQINNNNNILKQDNSEIKYQNEKLSIHLPKYKKHLNILISQNKILVNEIQFLLSRDNELKKILERDTHLKDVQFENDQIVKNSNEKLALSLGRDIYIEEKSNIRLKKTYSIEGNNGIKIIDSPSRKQDVNYVTNKNMPEREINSSINNIITEIN